ncbi:hypothetical protein E4T38_04808 [Aureobasidium subglaciale]|nr:hypothetical protein E4T38_04808 [Aureobasidium subglaciale]KAI5222854.1 hypothetical protein E4T40_04722 [Aureobasidium subglaciale]KAI5226693.1 hypothetical protein E4T41_04665 [Aureobasidium subglaciale]KAI5263026.1 hypothetical protein E4T46_03910 [Aureobasidium subglaciale]
MIAGTGLARKHNLEKCRKELERSCSNYQNRSSQYPAAQHTTSCTSSVPPQQQLPPKQKKKVPSQVYASLHETAHIVHRVKRPTFQYTEGDIRYRADRMRANLRQTAICASSEPSGTDPDPFDGRDGQDFSNNSPIDGQDAAKGRAASAPILAPRGPPTAYRQDLTHDELMAIRESAIRIAGHCAMRDMAPLPNTPPQEVLHRIRSDVWLARIAFEQSGADKPSSPEDKQDDNGISITTEGCILQRGFDISPPNSSPTTKEYTRDNSACEVQCQSTNENTRCEPIRPRVRNNKGVRIPVCFRKQEIVKARKDSIISSLLSTRASVNREAETEFAQGRGSQQRYRRQQFPRVLVFSVGSDSSGAIASDSEDDDDADSDYGTGEEEVASEKIDSAISSPAHPGGGKDVQPGGDGIVAPLVTLCQSAETLEIIDPPLLPQSSAPLSALSSTLQASSTLRAKQAPSLHVGTPLRKQLSKPPKLPLQSSRYPTVDPTVAQRTRPPLPLPQRQPLPLELL